MESEAHIEDKHFDGVHISQLLSFFLAPGICLDTILNSSFLMAWAQFLFLAGHDGYVILWDLRTGVKITSFYNSVSTLML